MSFTVWSLDKGYHPQEDAEWGDLLVEFLHSEKTMKRARFGRGLLRRTRASALLSDSTTS